MAQPDLIFEYLRERAGLSPSGLQRIGATEAIGRLQKKLNVTDVADLLKLMVRDKAAFDMVIAEVTVGETYFFRDTAQLNSVRRIALPALAEIRGSMHRYRIWSAGCSTGEEAYSLAILTEQEGLADRCAILGTDISQPALSRAKEGQYFPWSLRGLEPSFIERYFVRSGKTATVIDRIRDRVNFRQLNLAGEEFPSPETDTLDVDLILCRNVLIYFDPKTVEAVAVRFYKSLAPGGWLVMGASDPPLWQYAALKPVIVPGAVIYQKEVVAKHTALPQRRTPPLMEPGITARAAGRRSKPQGNHLSHSLKSPGAREKTRPVRKVESPSPLPALDGEVYDQLTQLAKQKGVKRAEAIAATMIKEHPLSLDLRYARSMLLIAQNEDEKALAELRRLIYLDRSLPAAHFMIGCLLQKNGDIERARRAFSNAHRTAAAHPPSESLRLGNGITASMLAEVARQRMLELPAGGDTL